MNIGLPVHQERNRNDFLIWPALILSGAWFSVHNLEYGLDVYHIPEEHGQYRAHWGGLPWEFRPLSLLIGMLAGVALSEGDIRQRIINGFGKGFYIAFVVLHSGLFGTLGCLRMTNKGLAEPGQYMPLVGTGLTLLLQYRKTVRKLPGAAWKRAKNVGTLISGRNLAVDYAN